MNRNMTVGLVLLAGALALAGCGGGSGGGGGGLVVPPGNSAPLLAVTGMSGTAPNYTLNVQTGQPLPGTVTLNGSDSNAGDNLQLSLTFNAGASSGFTTIPAAIAVSPGASGTPAMAVHSVVAPAASQVTLSPNGAITQAGTLVLDVLVTDGAGGQAAATLSIVVSATPANNPPVLGAPTGPGTAGGSSPSFTASLAVGASLAFSVTGTDPDASNTLTVTAAVTSGTLTAAQAGFSGSFPQSVVGASPRTLSLSGTAANAGSITLGISVSDGAGGSASISLAITITAATGGGSGSGGTGGAYPGNQSRTITTTAAGSQTYYLYIPSSYNPSTPMPVLFGFHGAGGSGTAPAAAQQVRNDWATVAAAGGFIVVAQAATGSGGGWVTSTDVSILNDIITDVWAAYNVDTKRVYGWGFSAGGHLMHAIGLGNASFFTAYGVSAGVLAALAGSTAPASATRKIPVDIHIGASDSLLPYAQQDKTQFTGSGWTLGTNLYYTEFSGGHTYTTAHLSEIWNNLKGHSLP